MKPAAFAPPLVFALALSGCTSTLSGVGGADGYACKAPEGALCTSVSGIYANAAQGMPKPTKSPEHQSQTATPVIYGATSIAPDRSAAVSGGPIRSNPRVLRLWIAPWEDADGDLHEAALVNVIVDTGRWLIEHVRPAARSRVDGVTAPVSNAQDPSPAKASGDTPQPPNRLPLPPTGPTSGAAPITTER
jgi:conjugal transfer pilus assembly protein TraV